MNSSTTILKGLEVMEYLAHSALPQGISEIAAAIGMNKSAVQRVLNTFVGAGYVEQAEGTRKYQMTRALWELGSQVIAKDPVRRQLHPILRYAAETTRCTAFVAYLSQPFMVYLDKVEGQHGRMNSSEPGKRIPISHTASGLATLAFLPKEAIETLRKPATDWTGFIRFDGINIERESERLQTIRERGYASSLSALSKGVNAVAAPIWRSSETPYGSLVLTADDRNMGEDDFDTFGTQVRRIAEDVTEALGGTDYRLAAERRETPAAPSIRTRT